VSSDRTFPLAQIVEAHRYLESNQQIGKVVVTVALIITATAHAISMIGPCDPFLL
jgi:hypothetical protein